MGEYKAELELHKQVETSGGLAIYELSRVGDRGDERALGVNKDGAK